MSNKIPCSVEILTRNSAATLGRCLESVKEFAEIIVLDGNSTDATREIAMQYGANICPQYDTSEPNVPIRDYSEVRNKGLRLSNFDWFMYIDSDEYLSRDAVEEIHSIVRQPEPALRAFWQPRKYVLDGAVVDCATTYPNRQIRFFHKNAVREFIKPIHERIALKSGAVIGELRGVEYVPVEPLQELKARWNRYTELEMQMYAAAPPRKIARLMVRHLGLFFFYTMRYVKNIFFCRARRMPFRYEWARHSTELRFSFLLLTKLFSRPRT